MLKLGLTKIWSAFFMFTFVNPVIQMLYRYIFFLTTLFLISSCGSDEDKGILLAKVYEKELYETDLNYLFEDESMSPSDSLELLQQSIDAWVNTQILVHEAEKSEKVNNENINQRAENYKNDLLINEIENVLISERLDTNVSEKEIKGYYENNQEAFLLNDYLVNVLYLKIPFDAPDVEDIAKTYKLRNEGDIENIEIYAKIYATNYYYDPEKWIFFDDILKEVPLRDINKDKFIINRSKIRFEENGYYYFLNVIDYKLKNTISPLEFERNNIKERIINTRIKKLRDEINNEIINKAYEEEAVTVY